MSLLWSSKRLTVVSPCQPVLLVALLGFDPGEALALETELARSDTLSAQWRSGDVRRADLWIVNGRSATVCDGDAIDVDGLRFRPGDVARPVAFAEPVASTLEARFHFDPASAASLEAMQLALGPWLSPRVVQQALVAHLVANAARFTRSTVIHVQEQERLLAVMNFDGDTGVATDATPAAIRRADWLLRPASAGFVPSIFHRAPTHEVLWRFATRAEHVDLLPARYLRLPVYLRRMPQVAPDEMSARQRALVGEIAAGGRTLRALRARFECGDGELRRDLAALYLLGAITCDPLRAIGTATRQQARPPAAANELSTNGSSAFGSPPARRLPAAGAGAARP